MIYNKGTLSLTSNTVNKITSNSYYTSTSYVIQNDGNLVSTGNTYKDLYTNSSSSPRRSAYIIHQLHLLLQMVLKLIMHLMHMVYIILILIVQQ